MKEWAENLACQKGEERETQKVLSVRDLVQRSTAAE